MSLTNKAIWMIERNLDRPLTLAEIAAACNVSNYHLAHAFGQGAGLPVMQYVRGRRLSAAAAALAKGAPDILDLALQTGYGSHEAFSRAFRVQFGTTPEAVRRQASTEGLPMIKALRLSDNSSVALAPPRFVSVPPLRAVGLAERHSFASVPDIAGQWQRFMVHYGDIADQATPIPLGISTNLDEEGNFDYVAAVEVARFTDVPAGLTPIRVPAQHYAVFHHDDHVSRIAATYAAIWNYWLSEQGRRGADGASLERHCQSFNPVTGLGGVDIWIPLQDSI